ncbi:MAG: acetyltransferase [Balneolales bacterium]
MNPNKKLIILGFCAGSIPSIIELADENEGISNFDIVNNIEVDDLNQPFKAPGYSITSYQDTAYNDQNFKEHPVHFGVLASHIKYILYYYFSHNRGIRRKSYLNLIHYSAIVSKSSVVGKGCFVDRLCIVSPFAAIGFGVTMKRGSSLGHHCILEDYVNLNPGSVISGNVSIGEGTEIGTGVSVVNNVSIGRHCLIGAGSVVTKNIPEGVLAYGNPCKVIRKNERWERAIRLTHQSNDMSKLREIQH